MFCKLCLAVLFPYPSLLKTRKIVTVGDHHTPPQWVQCEKRSDVWKHFLIDKNNKTRVKCKKFPIILEYVSSTTNMWRHMERAHPYLMDDASKSKNWKKP